MTYSWGSYGPGRHSCLFTPANLEWVLVLLRRPNFLLGQWRSMSMERFFRSQISQGSGQFKFKNHRVGHSCNSGALQFVSLLHRNRL